MQDGKYDRLLRLLYDDIEKYETEVYASSFLSCTYVAAVQSCDENKTGQERSSGFQGLFRNRQSAKHVCLAISSVTTCLPVGRPTPWIDLICRTLQCMYGRSETFTEHMYSLRGVHTNNSPVTLHKAVTAWSACQA